MPRLIRPIVLVPLAVVGVLAGTAFALPAVRGGGVDVTGLPNGPIGAKALDSVRLRIDGHGRKVALLVDGKQVASSGDVLVAGLGHLSDGKHVVTAEVDSGFPRGTLRTDRTVVVDTTPPTLSLDALKPVGIKDAVTVTGRTDAIHVSTSSSGDVEVGKDGRFSIHFDKPPVGVQVTANDAAGNTASVPLDVAVRHPEMRGVHLTALAWTSNALREPVLQLVKEGKIDTIELDIKDEDGYIGFNSTNPLARTIGASKGYYDAPKVIAQLHAMHVRVVGRLVAFRDPALASWAYGNGKKNMVIQAPDGSPYKSRYGAISFTNFADPEVRAYNIAIATEAAKAGFDDVLYDYCRRPDGPIASMRFPGLKETPVLSVAGFMRESRAALRPLGTYVGASVFGIAADRPTEVAQSVPEMAKYLDFVAPMVYPSHWAKGEYGVADPNRQPAPIVERSLKVFQRDLVGTNVTIAPWLQDFSLFGVTYGPGEVRAQIDAARRNGINSFLLWNAGARYQGAALDVIPKA